MAGEKRNVLLNPGPATTTNTVKMAQVVPDICPREKEFADLLKNMRKDFVDIVHGDHRKFTSVPFCGSGTMMMDVCLNSLLPANKQVFIINNGAYSGRAKEICQCYNLPVVELKLQYNERPELNAIEQLLLTHPDIHMIYTTHNETGTGLLNPVSEIGALAHKHGKVFVVDTISTYGLLPIDIEKDNIDFCMASAQKGLASMTGLSFIVGRKDLIEQSEQYPLRSFYCNLFKQYNCFEKTGEMQFTPPVQTVYATRRAIEEYFQEEEIPKYRRHMRVHQAIRKGLEKLGFQELLEEKLQSGLIATALYPNDANWDFMKIHDYCYERGFTIYPGKLFDTGYFRLCSLGAIDVPDIEAFFKVFEKALQTHNVKTPIKY